MISIPLCPGTNNAEGHAQWNNKNTVDAYYAGATPFVALLKVCAAPHCPWLVPVPSLQFTRPDSPRHEQAGDLIVYDPRVLHCGAENMPATGATRAMFNVGFRNPAFGNKDFGYKGAPHIIFVSHAHFKTACRVHAHFPFQDRCAQVTQTR